MIKRILEISNQEHGSGKKDQYYSLFLATVQALWLQLCLPMIPQLFLVAPNLAQPLLLSTAVDFVDSKEDKPDVFGYSLIGAFGLTYLGIAVRYKLYTISDTNLLQLTLMIDSKRMVSVPRCKSFSYDPRCTRQPYI